jgi:CBS-domain-containing membrane protein
VNPGAASPYSRSDVGINWQWDASALLLDIATSLALLVSVAFIFERWLRRDTGRWQFSVQAMLTLTAVAAVIAVLFQIDSPATWPWSFADPDWVAAIVGRCGHWYLGVPLLFAIGCAVAISLSFAGWILKYISPRRCDRRAVVVQ